MITMPNESIVQLFKAIDSSDWDGMLGLLHPDMVYERPGYPAFCGIDRVLQFYKEERILASGEHRLEHILCEGIEGACWGQFVGFKKDGSEVDERFVDVYTFRDGRILTRRSYFFRPAI